MYKMFVIPKLFMFLFCFCYIKEIQQTRSIENVNWWIDKILHYKNINN